MSLFDLWPDVLRLARTAADPTTRRRAQDRAHYIRNRSRKLAYFKARYQANPETFKAKAAKWRDENRPAWRAIKRKSEAKRRAQRRAEA